MGLEKTEGNGRKVEDAVETLIDYLITNWQLPLVAVVVILVITMLYKPRILFKLIEASTGYQLGTFVEKAFEEKAVAKSRRIINEAESHNDDISRCKEVLAAVVAQAGSIVERGNIKSFKVTEQLSCP